jgi:hypothetical protein
MSMLLFAAAVIATAVPPRPEQVVVQATATIRVVAAVRIKLDAPENPGAPSPRDSLVRDPDGTTQPARLIEFP